MLPQKRYKTIVKLLGCIRNYGTIRGGHIFIKLYGKNEILIQLPNFRAPIQLRSLRDDVSDVSVFDKIFIQNEYDIPIININPKFIIDGGANIGCSTVYFANKFPDSKILAVEPDRSNYERLVHNCFNYPNVTPINAAIWNKKTYLKIKNQEFGQMALQVDEDIESEKDVVSSLTILDLLELTNFDRIDILKLDIECAEEQVFGAESSEWLERVRIIIIELHDWIRPGCAMAFYSAISRINFRQFVYGENIVILNNGFDR